MDELSKARELLESSEPVACIELLTPIVQKGENLEALHLIGEAYLEAGNPEQAFQAFIACAELDPDGSRGGLEKFLWLGQLSGGSDGLEWFETGLTGLRQILAHNASDKTAKQKASEALCGMVEIWMTDLCMEPEAESECDKLIAEALMIDDSVPESWSVLGSIRISQQRNDEARDALQRSWQLFEADTPSVSVEQLPSLIRLSQSMLEMELLEPVLDITKRINRMDDEVADAYYLNGLAHYNLFEKLRQTAGSSERVIARHAAGARDAWAMLTQMAHGEAEVDPEMVEAVAALQANLPEVADDDFSSSEEEDAVDLEGLDSDQE